jgi:hypothetical protein
VGNDQLGASRRYYYLPNTWKLNQSGYWLGNADGTSQNAYYPGALEGSLGNPDITWERARKYDVGVESKFFDSRLSADFDWFYEYRNNILTTLGIIPAIYGVPQADVPPANVGETTNRGYELVLGWTDKIGDFIYTLGADISYSRHKILYMAEANNPYPWMNQTGHSIGQYYGYKTDGFYDTLEELGNRPFFSQSANAVTLGDIKYVDLNGDGLIDIKDITLLVNYILGKTSDGIILENADMNEDSRYDVTDLTLICNAILGKL